MKRLLLAAMMAVFAVSASAQITGPINFGVKAGLIVDNIDIKKGGKSGVTTLSSDPTLGWQVGLVSRINLPMFHIQPEILFNMHRYDLETVATGGSASKAEIKINTVDVPVMVGLRLLMLRFQAGPVFNVMTESKVKHNRGESHYVTVDRPTVSFAAGIGVDLWKLNIDARYNGNFKRVQQDIQVGQDGDNHTYRTNFNNWTFSLAYMF